MMQGSAADHLSDKKLPGKETGIEVKVIDLNDVVDHAIDLTHDLQAKIFLPFGAALREQAA